MKVVKYSKMLFMVAAGLWFLGSCTKADDYKKFQKGGEIIYAGTLDTVIAQSGKNKINILMKLGSDVSVTRVKIYWNDKLDSAQLAIARPASSNIVNLLIPDLIVGTYNFRVYTFDSNGNSSVVRSVSGIAYGVDYENSLVNRRIISATANAQLAALVLTWNEPNPGMVKTEITYTKKNGDVVTRTIANTETVTQLANDYLVGSTLTYRSTYKYDENSFEPYTVTQASVLTLK
jgi:hypothetical protein